MARFELSKKKVLEQYSEILGIADEVSYSFKTNYEVGEVLLKETDCTISLHSVSALDKVKETSRAWFFAQGWNKEEVKKVLDSGCCSFVVDSETDLDVLLSVIEKVDVRIKLLLRMRLKEHTVHTGKHYVYGLYTKVVNKLVPKLSSNPKIETLGLHMHRKTQNISEWSLQKEMEQSLDEEVLKNISLVNIGGGIPSIYKNHRAGTLENIFERIKETKKWLNSKGIKMIIEPGRFIAAPSVKLIAKIKNIYYNNIIIDCSVFNSAMDTFVAHIRLLIEGELEKGEAYCVKGITPDSMDIFRYRVFLDNPKVGDEIVFLNAGAYNFSTEFCLLSKLETVVVD